MLTSSYTGIHRVNFESNARDLSVVGGADVKAQL